MSNSRREQQKKAREQVAISAANATSVADSEDAKRKAVMNVVQVWLDRLQLISTIVSSAIYAFCVAWADIWVCRPPSLLA